VSLAITAVLAGGGYPRAVQLVITGLTVGEPFVVTGSTAAGWTWTVRGGNGQTASATTVILSDTATPINVPVTYTVEQTGLAPASCTPLTVPYNGRSVLQSLDGRHAFPFSWRDSGGAEEQDLRTAFFFVPGRSAPIVRWDVSSQETGELHVLMSATTASALKARLRTTGPLLMLRTDGAVRDFDPVQLIALRSIQTSLWNAQDGAGVVRAGVLAYTRITDPEPSIILAASTWDDFDAAYAALTWDDFAAEWAALTWDDFDQTDWSTH